MASYIIKEFYDSDLIEEEIITKWFRRDSVTKVSTVREQIEHLIKWFQDAEEESSGEEQ